jgi:hypothetical protein
MKKFATDKSHADQKPNRAGNPGPEQFELLSPPSFHPAWPTHGTLAAEALARLLTGERLTQPAFGMSRWRLAAYIKDLGYLGWPVKSALIYYPGRARPIAQYWLTNDTIAEAHSMQRAQWRVLEPNPRMRL